MLKERESPGCVDRKADLGEQCPIPLAFSLLLSGARWRENAREVLRIQIESVRELFRIQIVSRLGCKPDDAVLVPADAAHDDRVSFHGAAPY